MLHGAQDAQTRLQTQMAALTEQHLEQASPPSGATTL